MSFHKASISVKLGITFTSALAVVAVILTIISLASLDFSIRRAKERELEAKTQILSQSLEEQYLKSVMLASAVASMPEVQKAFADGDRETLTALTLPMFKKLKEDYAISQFQFHLPPATSFLRLHKLAEYGDDLSSFRFTVIKANKEKTSVYGLENGVGGLGIRGIAPVFYGNKHLGTVEFGLNFGQEFFEQFKKLNKADVALFIKDKGGYKNFASTFPDDFGMSENMLTQFSDGTIDISYMGESFSLIALPVNDYSGVEIGTAILSVNINDYKMISEQASLFNGLSLLLAAAIAIFFVWLANRLIGIPLGQMATRMIGLSEGDLDSDVPCRDRGDEIGKMAEAFGVFRKNAQERVLLENMNRRKQEEELQRAVKIKDAVEAFRSRIENVTSNLGKSSVKLQKNAQESSEALGETINQSSVAASSAECVSSNVHSVASAAMELAASAQEISKTVCDTTASVKECLSSAKISAENLDTLRETIGGIDRVIESINTVAEQTNLLALNATIEAARAGEAGKGFAVVAGEVKILAKQTADMTGEIAQMVSGIKNSAAGTLTAVGSIIKQINVVDTKTASVASAVEEQSSATAEISRNVNETASETRDISEKLSAIMRASDASMKIADDLKSSSHELAEQSEGLQEAVRDFLADVESS